MKSCSTPPALSPLWHHQQDQQRHKLIIIIIIIIIIMIIMIIMIMIIIYPFPHRGIIYKINSATINTNSDD